jgi:ribosome-associated protein
VCPSRSITGAPWPESGADVAAPYHPRYPDGDTAAPCSKSLPIRIEESARKGASPRAGRQQNVNRWHRELRFDVAGSTAIDDGMRQRLREIAGTRLTAEGVLVIDARRHRTQAANRQDARDRLVALLRQAAVRPKRRRKTRPTAGSVQHRIASKRFRSEKKRGRGKVEGEE